MGKKRAKAPQRAKSVRQKTRGMGYGYGGSSTVHNGVEVQNSADRPVQNVTPEERLVWSMLYFAAYELLKFRIAGAIDADGSTKMTQKRFISVKDDSAPAKVLYFWKSGQAQYWIDAVGGSLDADMCLRTMLEHPERGMVGLSAMMGGWQ